MRTKKYLLKDYDTARAFTRPYYSCDCETSKGTDPQFHTIHLQHNGVGDCFVRHQYFGIIKRGRFFVI